MNVDRTIKPLPNGEIAIHLPEIEIIKMENGLEVYYVNKPKLPIAQISLLVDSGSKYDPEGKKGMANITSMLIDEGAAGLNALEFDEEIEALGTILNISSDHDYTYFSMLTLLENFERSFELLSYLILDPTFSEDDFVKQKNKLLIRLVQLKDEPSYIASTVFDKILFDNTNYQYPVAGFETDINSIELNDIKTFYAKYFAANTAKLIVVGNITKDNLVNTINKFLSSWKSKEIEVLPTKKIELPKTKYFLIHRENAPQTEISIGNIAGNRTQSDFFDKVVLNSILGGQFTSRINLNLREDKGYTYGANSSFSYNKEYGTFIVGTSVKSEHTKDSIVEILKELKNIQNGVSDQEIEFAKSYLVKKYPSQFETYNQISTNLSLLAVHSLPRDYFNKYTQSLEMVNQQKIIDASKKDILNDNLVIVLVGNRDTIKTQLEEEIIELDFEGNLV